MKRFLTTMVLASVLSASAFAGEIPTSGVAAPPPNDPPPPTASGEVPSVGLTAEMSKAALTLVQLMLGTVV